MYGFNFGNIYVTLNEKKDPKKIIPENISKGRKNNYNRNIKCRIQSFGVGHMYDVNESNIIKAY